MSRTKIRRRPGARLVPSPLPLESRTLLAGFVVTSAGDAGPGTLRQAIASANVTVGPNTITFDIPGGGLQTIAPASPLPTITSALTIDGTSQPGFAGTPIVVLDGANAGTTNAPGLDIKASHCVIQGLDIELFHNQGINLESGNYNLIDGNYIGTDPTGSVAEPNGGEGIFVGTASNNTIGGTTPAARNLISGNKAQGIHFLFQTATANLIEGNYIGTDATGSQALANSSNGIDFFAPATFTTIGGTTAAARNVISGNSGHGITFFGSDSNNTLIEGNYIGTDASGESPIANHGNGVDIFGPTGTQVINNLISGNTGTGVQMASNRVTVQGNRIGTDATGTRAIGNQNAGVHAAFNSSNDFVGGTMPGQGNVIAYNGQVFTQPGVAVDNGSLSVAILGNSIHDNVGIGIDLGNDGVTLNTPGGPHDIGKANLDQNFPVIAGAYSGANSTTILGSLNSAPSTTYRIELYANPTADGSGYGQGQVDLGSTAVTTDASGNGSFSFTTAQPLPQGEVVTATATDPGEDTSEFAKDVAVTPPPPNDLVMALAATPEPVYAGQTLTYHATVTNQGPNVATYLTFADALPGGLTFVSASATQGSVGYSGGSVTGSLGSLAVGASLAVTIVVRPTSTGPTLTDVATVQANEPESPPGNNSASVTSTVLPSADLGVSIAESPAPIQVGETFTYTITATNAGPSASTGVTITDLLPASAGFVSATPSQGSYTVSGRTVVASLGGLAVGGTATLTIVVTAGAPGPISDQASVSAAESDPNASNNAATLASTVVPVIATNFAVNLSPSTLTAGTPGTLTVAAMGSFGTVATAYVGKVHFTSNDPNATLPADYTFTVADAGRHAFALGVTPHRAGSLVVTATDAASSSIAGSTTGVTVVAAAANGLTIAGPAGGLTAGTAGDLRVTAVDSFGNTATGYLGTVHFTSNDPGAILPADYTFTAADAGAHVFQAGAEATRAGTLTVYANDGGTPTVGGVGLVVVNPASAVSLAVAGFPALAISGVTRGVTVTAMDPYGNVASGYNGTVRLTAPADPLAGLPATYTFTAADRGTHSFGVTFNTSGTGYRIVANDPADGLTGSESGIEVDNPAPAVALLSPSTVEHDAGPTTVLVIGTGFVPQSVVYLDGAALTTTYVGPTQLQVSVNPTMVGGSYPIKVVSPPIGGGTSNAVALVVHEAPIAANGLRLLPKVGVAFSGVVATFNDPFPSPAGSYNATINWGDGHTTTGLVASTGGNGFSVSGADTYATPTYFPIVVTIVDPAGRAATANGDADLRPRAGDYDGDGKADIGVFRPSTATWYILNSSGTPGQTVIPYGWAGHDVPIPADYEGTGKADVAVYRPETSTWYVDRALAPRAAVPFGWAGHDTPVPAAYDPGGKAEIAVYRPSTGQWFLLHDLNQPRNPAETQTVNFGWINRDQPVPADYAGLGYAQLGVFRPDTGDWIFLDEKTGKMAPSVNLGYAAGDIPEPADYDGIGHDEPAVYRPSKGVFLIYNSATNKIEAVAVGSPNDVPVPEDYTGDGRVDVATYTPATSTWHYLDSTTGRAVNVPFGWAGHDIPLPAPLSFRAAGSGTGTPVKIPLGAEGPPAVGPGPGRASESPPSGGPTSPLVSLAVGGYRRTTRPAVAATATPAGPLNLFSTRKARA